MANLMALLSAVGQAGPSVAGLNPEDIINVTAGADTPPEAPLEPVPPYMGNRKYLEEAATANNMPLPEEVQRQRRGMFGVRGTLRDVLGTLGDAFLVQGGGEATYRPQRERERLSDAMTGYTASPEAAMAAVERVTQLDPEAGQALYEQIQNEALRRSQIEGTQANQANQARDRDWGNYTTLRNYAARILQQVSGNPEQLGYALSVINSHAQRAGVTLEELGISPDMTPEQLATYAAGDMSVNQQVNVPFTERRVAATEANVRTNERNAATNERRAAASEARPPRSETDSERYIRLGDLRFDQMTAGEQEWYRTEHARRNSRGGSSGPQLPSSSSDSPRRLTMPQVRN